MAKNQTHSLKDVDLSAVNLLVKGHDINNFVGKIIIVNSFIEKIGNMGDYLEISIEGSDKPITTGAVNIVGKLRAAKEQSMLPLECKVSKHGNSYDIE